MKKTVFLAALLIFAACADRDEQPVLAPPGVVTASAPQATEFVRITSPIPLTPPLAWSGQRVLFRWEPIRDAHPIHEFRTIMIPASEFQGNFTSTLRHIQRTPDEPRWSPWTRYSRNDATSHEWYSPKVADGRYVFGLQTRSANGIEDATLDPGRNARFVEVRAYYGEGPLLTVASEYVAPFEGIGLGAVAKVLIPAGAPMDLRWWADASHLSVPVDAYRTGWDLSDVMDDDQWGAWRGWDGSCASDDERTFQVGTHIFSVEARDSQDRISISQVIVSIVSPDPRGGVLDIRPGNAGDRIGVHSGGHVQAVLAGTARFNAGGTVASSVTLNGVTPLSTRVADAVTVTGVPEIGTPLARGADGFADFIMTFDTRALVASIMPAPEADGSRVVELKGSANVGGPVLPFSTWGVVRIEGFGGPGDRCGSGKPAKASSGRAAGDAFTN